MSIFADDTAKSLRFLDGESDITNLVLSGSFSMDDILCSGQLNFGECNSAQVQFTTITNLGLTGHTIAIQFGAGDEWEDVGRFRVTYSSTQANSEQVRITAYDKMKDFDVDISEWYEALTFPLPLKAFRDALIGYIGAEQVEVELINDDMPVYKTISPSTLKGMDMMFYIGQINAVFPHATADGKIDWISLGTDIKVIEATMTQGQKAFTASNYTTRPISKLIIRQENGDLGVRAGTGANVYVIQNNVLVYGFNTEELTPIATKIFNKIQGITYTPATITMKHIPTWKMGDMLQYDTSSFYMLSRKSKGILYDTIQAGGTEYLEEDTGIESSLKQLRGKSNVLTRDLEQTQLKIADVEAGMESRITQLANEVSIQIEYMQDEIDGSQEIIYVTETPTLENYPAWDWCATPIFDQSEFDENGEIPWTYTDESYHEHMRTLVYDETESVTYRFIKRNEDWIFEVLANNDFAVILSEITELKVTDSEIRGSVSAMELSLENDYFTKAQTNSLIKQTKDSIELSVAGTYVTQGTLASGYYSKAETQSLISQTTSSISLSVAGTYATKTSVNETYTSLNASISLKLNKEDLISEINASADVIKLTSNRLIISSTHFSLSSNGTCKMTNADVTGKFTMTGGTILIETASETDNHIIMSHRSFSSALCPRRLVMSSDSYEGTYDGLGVWLNHAQYTDTLARTGYIVLEDSSATSRFYGNVRIDKSALLYGNVHCYADFYANEDSVFYKNVEVFKNLKVYGTKNRIVAIEDNKEVALNAYETATPYFGDIGASVIGEDGTATIEIDDVFAQTIEEDTAMIFISPTCADNLWSELVEGRFVVHGQSGSTFNYEIKAIQKGYRDTRLDVAERRADG
jgi:hypothetical protein